MSFAGWMIFVAIVVPVVGILVYFLADDALIRVDPGKLGLLVIKGRATDKTLHARASLRSCIPTDDRRGIPVARAFVPGGRLRSRRATS